MVQERLQHTRNRNGGYRAEFFSAGNGGVNIFLLAMVKYNIWTADIQIAVQIAEMLKHLRWPRGHISLQIVSYSKPKRTTTDSSRSMLPSIFRLTYIMVVTRSKNNSIRSLLLVTPVSTQK